MVKMQNRTTPPKKPDTPNRNYISRMKLNTDHDSRQPTLRQTHREKGKNRTTRM